MVLWEFQEAHTRGGGRKPSHVRSSPGNGKLRGHVPEPEQRRSLDGRDELEH